jgi:glycerophosphoryl diester phosphodiesterase
MNASAPAWRGEIIGHRGAAGLAPENTLESLAAAIRAGADRVEFDVRRTQDGQAVVFHDLTVDRFVPNARGRSVSRHALAEMIAIDVGAALGRPGCLVPSLDAALDALAGRIKLNVEVKGSGADGLITVDLVALALRARRLEADSVVSSFHEPVLRHLAARAPELARAFIFDGRALIGAGSGSAGVIATASENGCEAVHPKSTLVDSAFMARCRATSLRVRAWTVNDEAEMRRLMALEVDGIVTDFPDRLRDVAGRDSIRP